MLQIAGLLFLVCTLVVYLLYRYSGQLYRRIGQSRLVDESTPLKDSLPTIVVDPYAIQTSWSDAQFWIDRTGPSFRLLSEQTSCPQSVRDWSYWFYTNILVPQLGPSPRRFTHLSNTTGVRPYSYVSDDFTPIELNWVIDGDGSSTMQFAMDMVSSTGVPVDLENCASFVDRMALMVGKGVKPGFNTSWNKICRETMGTSSNLREKAAMDEQSTHFFFGGKITPEGVMLKESYVPGTRALLEGCSSDYLVTNCMRRLGITSWDSKVLPYLESLPTHVHRPSPDMVSIDCVEPSKNRIKVYFRCYDKTFEGVVDRLTLGGRLNDSSTRNLIQAVEELWGLLFPGVGYSETLPVKDCSRPSWLGFLVYHEMRFGTEHITPKVYIPVRQYCSSDAEVVDVVERYLEMKGLPIGDKYGQTTRRLFSHRDLASGTGIHHYVGICWRSSGPQISMYLSPEAFSYETN